MASTMTGATAGTTATAVALPQSRRAGLDAYLATKHCCECEASGLEAGLGVVYDTGDVVCIDCEDIEMGDGTLYSEWKIQSLVEVYFDL